MSKVFSITYNDIPVRLVDLIERGSVKFVEIEKRDGRSFYIGPREDPEGQERFSHRIIVPVNDLKIEVQNV